MTGIRRHSGVYTDRSKSFFQNHHIRVSPRADGLGALGGDIGARCVPEVTIRAYGLRELILCREGLASMRKLAGGAMLTVCN